MTCLWFSNDEMVSTLRTEGAFCIFGLTIESLLDWRLDPPFGLMNLFFLISIEVFGLVTCVFCIFGPTDDNCIRNDVTRNITMAILLGLFCVCGQWGHLLGWWPKSAAMIYHHWSVQWTWWILRTNCACGCTTLNHSAFDVM